MPDGLSFTPINDISDLVIRDKKVQQLKDFDFNVFRCATISWQSFKLVHLWHSLLPIYIFSPAKCFQMCYHLSEFETRENKRKKRRPSNSQEIATQVPLATNILKPTYLQLISNLSATYYKANLSATYIQLICNLL